MAQSTQTTNKHALITANLFLLMIVPWEAVIIAYLKCLLLFNAQCQSTERNI